MLLTAATISTILAFQPAASPASAPVVPPSPPALAPTPAPESSAVVLRGPGAPAESGVASLDVDGVTFADGRTLSWDRVLRVTGPLAVDFDKFRDTAERAWRARSRLERGDAIGAEPIFEDLFAQYAGHRGPTARVIAEGVLRCRLKRGVQTGAIAPWLAWMRASESARADLPQQPELLELIVGGTPLLDSQTLLVPSLPPIWLGTPATQALARTDLAKRAGGQETATRSIALANLFQRAARFEAGLLPTDLPSSLGVPPDAGLSLVSDIVEARCADDATRKKARAALTERLQRRAPQWMEAWIRVGIGRSLLRETSEDERLLGVAELLHLPARMERVNPYLTGIALAESAVTLSRMGEVKLAAILRDELIDRFPGHPALEWEPIRAWGPVSTGTTSEHSTDSVDSLKNSDKNANPETKTGASR